jgi:hypothetical protein
VSAIDIQDYPTPAAKAEQITRARDCKEHVIESKLSHAEEMARINENVRLHAQRPFTSYDVRTRDTRGYYVRALCFKNGHVQVGERGKQLLHVAGRVGAVWEVDQHHDGEVLPELGRLGLGNVPAPLDDLFGNVVYNP